MNTKNNARSRASREALRRGLLTLLEQQELQEITVAQLCREAGVNRSTFYSHYENIWNVLEELEEEMDQSLRAQLRWVTDIDSAMLDQKTYLVLTRQIAAYPAFFRARYHNPSVRAGRFDSGMQWLKEEMLASAAMRGRNHAMLLYYLSYTFAGITEVLRSWVDGGCQESAQEIADVLYEMAVWRLHMQDKQI